jgi:hypothetical protein
MGKDQACYGQIFSKDRECVFSWGTETPPVPKMSRQEMQRYLEFGDVTDSEAADSGDTVSVVICDGRNRVACGEVGELCGLRIYCECSKDPRPETSKSGR